MIPVITYDKKTKKIVSIQYTEKKGTNQDKQ